MHSELAGHDRERCALLVAGRGEGDRFVGHLANDAPSGDAGLVEVVDDRCSMYSVQAGERVDRRAVSIEADQSIDLGRRQSSLDRV